MTSDLASRFAPLLARREAELRALLLASACREAGSSPVQDVGDFKDIAAEQSRERVEEVQGDHAAQELDEVIAARQRIREGHFGDCTDCGEPIDERRLRALPFARFCIACQSIHEHQGAPRARSAAPPLRGAL